MAWDGVDRETDFPSQFSDGGAESEPRSLSSTERLRRQIENDIETFLADGGEIETLGYGERSRLIEKFRKYSWIERSKQNGKFNQLSGRNVLRSWD